MKKEIVKIENISVEINGNIILKNHHLNVYDDDFIGIIGPNGGGKTTLLRVILGLVAPTQGRITVFGKSASEGRKRIGYVPQVTSFDKDFPINVMDVVLMGRLSVRPLFQRYTSEDRNSVERALDRLEISHLKHRQIGQLSGGERQRVYLARAIVGNPELLLLDEPTASIDQKMKTSVYDLLGILKKDMAILLVTHDMGVISSHVDKIACLNCELFYHDNKEISQETMAAVYNCPVDLIAHGVPHRVLEKHQHEDK
jgi:zinc transport system ATP-binding protein